MDYTSKQSIYDAIKIASKDGKALWPLISQLHTHMNKLQREVTTYREENTRRENRTKEEKENGLDSLPNLSDAELRSRVKNHLLVKLDDGSLSGSDIGQLKDIFGLASKVEELRIETVDYSNAIIDCPHCSTNIHAPVACLHPVST